MGWLRLFPLSLALAGCHLLFPLDGYVATDSGAGAGDGGNGMLSCEGAWLCDGFEAGIGSDWTTTYSSNGGAVGPDTQQKHRGDHSLHSVTQWAMDGDESTAFLRNETPVRSLFYARVWLYLPAPAPPGSYAFVAAQESGDQYYGTQLGFQDGRLQLVDWANMPNLVAQGMNAFPTGKWVCLEWMLDSVQNETRVWQDGAELPELHLTGLTTPTYGWFRLGLDVTAVANVSYALWLDDLYVGTQPVGCDR